MWTEEHRKKLTEIYTKFLGDVNNTTSDLDSLNFVTYLLEIENVYGLELPETIIDRAVFSDFSTTQAKIIELLNR